MSYQVLARKWRPRIFKEMVGQEHVLKALINALDNNRLHHAYLFTGTRGVGKTTIARVLAKCLNCEVGVSSEPCGECGACQEINQGNFVDLIEVDAASRTKVEDTRELMDNVQYMPTKGRFKVYLIDEVHMLSGHSFNALLKTLEEPPPHVKFLLATTDPHKLPITILSRCLQFNLKNLSPERIEQYLEHVLAKEGIPFETSALWLLARSADGSMRDALSLTDQAISFGNGQIKEADVSSMLGTIDQRQIIDITEALAAGEGKQVLRCVEQLAEHLPDYSAALADLIVFLHRIAIAQTVPEVVDNTYGDQQEVLSLAKIITAEDVQLFYQTALLGRRDLPLSPDPRTGFEMTLLRMLAFKPQGSIEPITQVPKRSALAKKSEQTNDKNIHGLEDNQGLQVAQEGSGKKFSPDAPAEEKSSAAEADAPVTEQSESSRIQKAFPTAERIQGTQVLERSIESESNIQAPVQPNSFSSQPLSESIPASLDAKTVPGDLANIELSSLSEVDWHRLVGELNVGGVIKNTALNCQLLSCDSDEFSFLLDETNSTLYDQGHQARLQDALKQYFSKEVKVVIRVGAVSAETPAVRIARLKHERQERALQSMRDDPIVKELIQNFGATLSEDTVVPVDD